MYMFRSETCWDTLYYPSTFKRVKDGDIYSSCLKNSRRLYRARFVYKFYGRIKICDKICSETFLIKIEIDVDVEIEIEIEIKDNKGITHYQMINYIAVMYQNKLSKSLACRFLLHAFSYVIQFWSYTSEYLPYNKFSFHSNNG